MDNDSSIQPCALIRHTANLLIILYQARGIDYAAQQHLFIQLYVGSRIRNHP